VSCRPSYRRSILLENDTSTPEGLKRAPDVRNSFGTESARREALLEEGRDELWARGRGWSSDSIACVTMGWDAVGWDGTGVMRHPTPHCYQSKE